MSPPPFPMDTSVSSTTYSGASTQQLETMLATPSTAHVNPEMPVLGDRRVVFEGEQSRVKYGDALARVGRNLNEVESCSSDPDDDPGDDYTDAAFAMFSVVKLHAGAFGINKYTKYLQGSMKPKYRFYETADNVHFGCSTKSKQWWRALFLMMGETYFDANHAMIEGKDCIMYRLTSEAFLWLKLHQVREGKRMKLENSDAMLALMATKNCEMNEENRREMTSDPIVKKLDRFKTDHWFSVPYGVNPKTQHIISPNALLAYRRLGEYGTADSVIKAYGYDRALFFAYMSYCIAEARFGLSLESIGMNKNMVESVRKICVYISHLRPIMDRLPTGTMDYDQLKVCVAILVYEYDFFRIDLRYAPHKPRPKYLIKA